MKMSMARKLLAIFLVLCTVAVSLPALLIPVSAAEGVEYLSPIYVNDNASKGVSGWEKKTVPIEEITYIQGNQGSQLLSGWYLCKSCNITSGLQINGDVKLILEDDATINITQTNGNYSAITLFGGSNLTIYSQSKGNAVLNITASGYGAGIGLYYGTDPQYNYNSIVVNGGNITAVGGNSGGAGIGASAGSNVPANMNKAPSGTIIINGGTITATGGTNAAGIGGGEYCSSGPITINGGKVKAVAGAAYGQYSGGGAAIGSGCNANTVSVGTITVNGGDVTAEGKSNGDAIGKGYNGGLFPVFLAPDMVIKGGESLETLVEFNEEINYASAVSGKKVVTLQKKYAVTVASSDHGTVSADVEKGLMGTNVTLTVTPDSGYELSALKIYKTGDPATEVSPTDNQFQIPDYSVTVEAIFSEIQKNVDGGNKESDAKDGGTDGSASSGSNAGAVVAIVIVSVVVVLCGAYVAGYFFLFKPGKLAAYEKIANPAYKWFEKLCAKIQALCAKLFSKKQ